MYDTIIIGSGPAGLSAAVYAKRGELDFILIEKEYGGTGKSARIDLILNREIAKPFFIAGGISADNISDVSRLLGGRAYGFDVSSGIETDGVKDREKIQRLTEIFRKELI